MNSPGLTLAPDGYFYRESERFVPIGANYWPASCGVHMWQAWPIDEIQGDLNLLASLGLNCIRFFLRWEDFEPAAGEYDSAMFERLNDLLIWCAERGIYAQPTLFAPHASGPGPAWKDRQNFFTDHAMRQRAVDFAFTTARVLAPHHGCLAGVDVGHNLSRLPDSRAAGIDSINAWCRDVTSAINSGYRESLVVCGNGIDQVAGATGWRMGDLPGCDFLAMHGSTFPRDHPVASDGLTDPLAHTLLPLYTELARSFGPVMVQDMGIAPNAGIRQQDIYLRAVLPLCWNAGANGFLWGAFRNAAGRSPIDQGVGLIDDLGMVKPGLHYFVDFAHALPETLRPRISPGYIGLYLPRNFYACREAVAGESDPQGVCRSLCVANYFLRSLGHETRIVRGDRPISPRTRTIVIGAPTLDEEEIRALCVWVEAGGKLIWHGPDPLHWGEAYEELLGAQAVDFRAPRDALLKWAGQEWRLSAFPRDIRLEIDAGRATVHAVDEEGMPLVLRHGIGRGHVTFALAQVEESISRNARGRSERDRWRKWYHAMLRD